MTVVAFGFGERLWGRVGERFGHGGGGALHDGAWLAWGIAVGQGLVRRDGGLADGGRKGDAEHGEHERGELHNDYWFSVSVFFF